MTDPIEVQQRHQKQKAVMGGWLDGRGYFDAARAFRIVQDLESGTRKDGQTPKFHHQLSVVRLLTTLEPHFLFKQETITAAFLHDILEDHTADGWTGDRIASEFGKQVADAVWLLTKKTGGWTKTYDNYFASMARCPIASLVKLADRAHNLQTMPGVFSTEKQTQYLAEVDQWFFPMIKTARRLFPSQYAAYENLKITLRNQAALIRLIHEAAAR